MALWVQFYQEAAVTEGAMVPACGDRGVVILDGRWSNERAVEEARAAARDGRRPQYPAFRVYRGPRFPLARLIYDGVPTGTSLPLG
jgi:hypothetical protein